MQSNIFSAKYYMTFYCRKKCSKITLAGETMKFTSEIRVLCSLPLNELISGTIKKFTISISFTEKLGTFYYSKQPI